MKLLRGRIVDVYTEDGIRMQELIQGIPKYMQYKYENNPKYGGWNGSYVYTYGTTPSSLIFKVFMFDLNKTIKVDMKDKILMYNNMSRISAKLIQYLLKHNKGKKIYVRVKKNSYSIGLDEIRIDYK
ncbi:hypothetical protein [Neobacillus soli]|uniref:hypothetical protein n=1 Tax=Neobacillus soli TaxID=220688 RepID=UPI00082498A3|nr:hypothetical protein [Neobacillus soli]